MRNRCGFAGLSAGIALMLSACASNPLLPAAPMETVPATARATELPPQELAPGQCASFFWGADADHRFLAFENETTGAAQVIVNGSVEAFRTQSRMSGYRMGESYRRAMVDPARGLNVEISGLIGEPLSNGMRIDRAILRLTEAGGTQTIIPLVGHFTCRIAS